MPTLARLMNWYRSQCDGVWQYRYGIRIHTLDNPGWSLYVDLHETCLAGRTISTYLIEKTEDNWYFFSAKDNLFDAAGWPCNLSILIDNFSSFVEDEHLICEADRVAMIRPEKALT